MLPEWLQTFRKDFKEAVCVASCDLKDAADKKGQQHAASVETIPTVEKTQEEYWCVPKTNFPNGLPDAIKECVEDPNALVSAQLHAGCSTVASFDSDNFYIVDKVIPRTSLGKGVTTLKFYAGSATSHRTNTKRSKYTQCKNET